MVFFGIYKWIGYLLEDHLNGFYDAGFLMGLLLLSTIHKPHVSMIMSLWCLVMRFMILIRVF